jgi:hypothetical protein
MNASMVPSGGVAAAQIHVGLRCCLSSIQDCGAKVRQVASEKREAEPAEGAEKHVVALQEASETLATDVKAQDRQADTARIY